MGRFKPLLGATTAALVLTAGVAMAQGVVPDRSTIVTISAPVSVPGVVLPAGEYLFRLADSNTSRNIVQIYDKDRTKIFATLIAIPAERNEPRGDAVVTFNETPANQPPALRFWYFAGEKAGNEFAYPKHQAIEIARASRESVMAMDTASTNVEDMQKAELHRIEADSPEVTQQAEAPAAAPPATEQPATPTEPQAAAPVQAEPQAAAPAPAVTPEPAAPAAPAATEPQATGTSGRDVMPAPAGTSGTAAPAAADRDRELPKTAGELPLVTMLGVLALGAAFSARALRRRMTL
jgi:hypothetical protein